MATATSVLQEVGQSLPPDTLHVCVPVGTELSALTWFKGRQCVFAHVEVLCWL